MRISKSGVTRDKFEAHVTTFKTVGCFWYEVDQRIVIRRRGLQAPRVEGVKDTVHRFSLSHMDIGGSFVIQVLGEVVFPTPDACFNMKRSRFKRKLRTENSTIPRPSSRSSLTFSDSVEKCEWRLWNIE